MSDTDYGGASSATDSQSNFGKKYVPRNSAAAHQFATALENFSSPDVFPNSSPSPDSAHQKPFTGQQPPQYVIRSRRQEGMTAERRSLRMQWQCGMWVPFLLLLLHRQESIARATHGWMTVTNVFVSLALLVPTGCYNEYQDGLRFPSYFFGLLVGFLWGMSNEDTQDLTWARIATMMWFGFGAAKLRYHRDVKRLSGSSGRGTAATATSSPAAAAAAAAINAPAPAPFFFFAAWNYIERKIGIAFCFLIGECLSVFALLPFAEAITHILDGALGTALFLTAPFVATNFGMTLSKYVPLLFQWWGGNALAHQAVRGWRQTIVLIITIVLSVGVFVVVLGYFLATYLPFMWNHAQLAGAIGIIVEQVVFNQTKDEAREARVAKAEARRKAAAEQQQRQSLYTQQQPAMRR